MDKEKLPVVSAIALNAIFGYEPKFSHNIIDALGSAEAVFSLPQDEILRIFGPYSKYSARICRDSLDAAEREHDRLREGGYQFLSIFDEGYPSALRDCPDAPIVLYVRSATPAGELFNRVPAVSIVGTRDISPYGREWCRKTVGAIADAPSRPMIVSGMALGVDITAHLAALDEGLPTIGVSPVGIEDVYPRRHMAYAERMVNTPGCALVTDYPPGTGASAVNFLRRNRIIAGISSSTILIESRIRGGGMMTARLAYDYGREVFALPGRIDDARSQGCNHLLREKVAEPISDLAGLPSALGLGTYNLRKYEGVEQMVRGHLGSECGEDELEKLVKLALTIKKNRGIDIDGICRECGLGYSEAANLTGMLENEGLIEMDLLQRCTINLKKA